MNQPLQAQLVGALLLLCSLFMAVAGILGFIGWSSDPSNQKWWALLCGLIGVAGFALFWKSDEITDEEVAAVTSYDDWIKSQSVEQQRLYWKKERRKVSIGSATVLAALIAACLLWEAARDYWFLMGYLLLSMGWQASKRSWQIARELKQLARG